MLGSIKSNCGAMGTPYTGIGSCPKKEGKVSALLITGKNALYPMESEDFVSGLSGYVTTADALKMYPIKGVVGMTINGGEINAPDLGTYGGPVPTNLTAKNIAYQVDAGDCLYKEISKFNKRKMRVLRVDDEGFVYGTVVVRDGKNYFAGFEATLYAVRTPTDGSTAYNLSLYAYYTPSNESEEKNMHAFEVGLPNVPDGLIGAAGRCDRDRFGGDRLRRRGYYRRVRRQVESQYVYQRFGHGGDHRDVRLGYRTAVDRPCGQIPCGIRQRP
ncbi:hypothetical protein [Alistipes indistinctus]|uniref:hypothetical protein n=1 Tax=Alistipes indistinctus TaxID=626932 RepID=UPI00242FC6D0|nr:hypothetical protein [Alistipes indistinctus]